MTRAEATRLVAILVAAYPETVLEQESLELYVQELQNFSSAEAGEEAVRSVIRDRVRFPALAILLHAYGGALKRRGREISYERQYAAIEEESPGPRELPRAAADLLEKLQETMKMPIEEHLTSLPSVGTGKCDECGTQDVDRVRYGQFLVCRRCASHRLHALAKTEAF